MGYLIIIVALLAIMLSFKALLKANQISGRNAFGWRYLGRGKNGIFWELPDGRVIFDDFYVRRKNNE